MTTVCCLRPTRYLILLGLAVAVTLPSVSSADQPPCPNAQCGAAERGVPFLSRVPYVSRLFKNVGIGHAEACEQCCEVIGVDFDFSFAAPCGNTCISVAGQATECAVPCAPGCAVPCAPAGAAACATGCVDAGCSVSNCQQVAVAESVCRPEVPGPSGGYGVRRTVSPAAGCPAFSGYGLPFGGPHEAFTGPQTPFAALQPPFVAPVPYGAGQYVTQQYGPAGPPVHFAPPATTGWMSQILPLLAENAGLRAQLELHETLVEQQTEAFGAILEAAQAVVEVRNEMQKDRDGLVEQLTSALIENAQLKANLELAEQREAMVRELVASQIENLRLRQQVESLARRAAEAGVQLTVHSEHAESLSPPTPAREARGSAKRNNRKPAEIR